MVWDHETWVAKWSQLVHVLHCSHNNLGYALAIQKTPKVVMPFYVFRASSSINWNDSFRTSWNSSWLIFCLRFVAFQPKTCWHAKGSWVEDAEVHCFTASSMEILLAPCTVQFSANVHCIPCQYFFGMRHLTKSAWYGRIQNWLLQATGTLTYVWIAGINMVPPVLNCRSSIQQVARQRTGLMYALKRGYVVRHGVDVSLYAFQTTQCVYRGLLF